MHTVLIVDDEPAVVEALSAQLLPLGVWIEGAYSAAEALPLLESRPAVVIADYLMPGMRGDDFLIAVHQQQSDARLILLTGQAGAENIGKIVNQARLFRYIAKPWEVEDLRLTVREALASYEAEKALAERQQLTQQLVAYLQDLLACSQLEALEPLARSWSQKLFGTASWETPSPDFSQARQEAWTLFTQTYALRQAHLTLLADLENQVQARTAHLLETLQTVQALSSQREAWIKIISHDLRGPLSALKQLAALLSTGEMSEAHRKKYSQTLADSLAQLERYTKSLLDLARLSQKELVLQPERFSWAEMAERLHGLVAPQLALKKLQWESEIPPGAQGWGDPTYSLEALYNLVANAVKFTPTGGRVAFRVQEGPQETWVEIQDTGIGMEPELITQLWDPTQRRSRPGTAGERGTGLGLPLAHALLTQQGVKIQVDSTPGQGTIFRLLWPKP